MRKTSLENQRSPLMNRSLYTSPCSQDFASSRVESPWPHFKKIELLPSLRDREPIKNNPLPASHIKDVKSFMQNLQKTVALPSQRSKAARSLMGTKDSGAHNFSFGNEFSVTRKTQASMTKRVPKSRHSMLLPHTLKKAVRNVPLAMKQAEENMQGISPQDSHHQSQQSKAGQKKVQPKGADEGLPKLPDKAQMEKKAKKVNARAVSMSEPVRKPETNFPQKKASKKIQISKRKATTEDNERAKRIAGDPAVNLFIVDIKSKLGLMRQDQKTEIENDLFREHIEAMEAKRKSSSDQLDFSKIGSAGSLLLNLSSKAKKSVGQGEALVPVKKHHSLDKRNNMSISVPLEQVKERTQTFGQESYILDRTERSALDNTLIEINGQSRKSTQNARSPKTPSKSPNFSRVDSPARSPLPHSTAGSAILSQVLNHQETGKAQIDEESGSDFDRGSQTSSLRRLRYERQQQQMVKRKISRARTREIVGSIMSTIMAQTSKSPDSTKIIQKARVNANKHLSESNWQDDYNTNTRSPLIIQKYREANRKHKRMSSELNRGNTPYKYLKLESRESFAISQQEKASVSSDSTEFDPSNSTFPFINALFSDKKNLSYIASDHQYKKIERILNERYGYKKGSGARLDSRYPESPLASVQSRRTKDKEGNGAVNELSFFKESGKSGHGSKKDTKQQIELHTRYLNHLFLKTADDFLKMKYYAYIGKGQKKHKSPALELTETKQEVIAEDSSDELEPPPTELKKSPTRQKMQADSPKGDKITPMKQLFKQKVQEIMNMSQEVLQTPTNKATTKKTTNLVDSHIEKLQRKLKKYEEIQKQKQEEQKRRGSTRTWFD